MTQAVTIQTGCRLHFGLLAHRPRIGRQFGGAGLMLQSPGVSLTATACQVGNSSDQILGPDALINRVKTLVERFRQSLPKDQKPPACVIELHQHIPAHQGLGSGTQLALAVGKALAVLSDQSHLSALELANRVGRGARSALGIHGFQHGGFLVDGGKREQDDIGQLVWRTEFPKQWRIVLVTPTREQGLSGTEELTAFEHLPPMPEALTNHLCKVIVMELMPALLDQDFHAVSQAIHEYGQQVGGYFEPVQGGKLASRQMTDLAGHLRSLGIPGVGQSSWGPTLFVLQESQTDAEALIQNLQQDPKWQACQFHLAEPLNHSALVRD